MRRVRLKRRKKFVYRSRDPEALLRRIGRAPKKLKHDAPIPADDGFILCVKGLSHAQQGLDTWRRNLNRYWEAILADHEQRDHR